MFVSRTRLCAYQCLWRREEPCPFSPYSDRNLSQGSLLKAIDSPLLRLIRKSDVKLDESNGHCALWKRREWVEALLARSTQGLLLAQSEQEDE